MKFVYLLLVSVVCHISAYAQDYKFGDVSIAELQEKSDTEFPEADAKVITRDVEYNFGEVLYVFERIKIYTKEGFEYAKWQIDFDDVESLKANTYNLENGKIVVTKVEKGSIFNEEINDGEEVSKISFPNVKEGSVLELKYKVRDIGLRSINSQSYIPIESVKVLIKNPYSRELKITQNPLSDIALKTLEKPYELLYVGKDIPPLKKENYVTSLSTYQGKIYIEQVGTYGQNKMKNWTDVAEFYNDAHYFGAEVKRSGYFKSDLDPLLVNEIEPLELAKNIYYFLQKRMKWNEFYSRGADETRTAYKEKEGSISQINVTLTAMLRKAGLKANPVLAATKSRGYILFPTIIGFNAILTAVEIDDKIYLLDASRKNAAFGELPSNLINGIGLIVYENDMFKTIPTSPTKSSKSFVIANATLDVTSGAIIGDYKQRLSGYFANRYRKDYTDKQANAYWNDLQKENNLLYFSKTDTKDMANLTKPIMLETSFKKESYLEEISGNLYLDPLFIFGLKENKFTDENRKYPIDFVFPYSKTYKITFKIPDGYTVESLPEGVNIAMQDNIASIKYDNKVSGNSIMVSLDVEVNYPLIAADYYEGIKTIFTEYYKISNSKIVLSKN
ncbi:hypothetical protein ULMS_24410 [Patiriisocius marinistellae]|uniref:Uncharacterized protein n=1 Tax=Patiriisocius marinistellae TaxID=2494560 RepID=A0A5J4FXZ9_9FLAO|nr:DUF3857 domain-containing protein [Patiriisocius marinistellae]GEQ86933.1 hypothetical protein ULMS_24410 [Patiriisocius marinistellae]